MPMRMSFRSIAPVALVVSGLTLTGIAQTRDRSAVPDKYKWNLADIYPTDDAWRAEKDRIAKLIPTMSSFKGKLGTSAATLADALEKASTIDRTASRLYVYASMQADQDTRDAAHQGMQQEMLQLYAGFGAQTSFIEPEVLRF